MSDAFWQDIRHAWRSLRHTPGFTVAATLTLALGIGATTAIFSVVNAALLKPLPYPEPDRLLVLAPPPAGSVTGQVFLHMRERARIFTHVAGQGGGGGANFVAGDHREYVATQRVSDGFFATHAVEPLLGRELTPAEALPNGPNAVVLGEALWRRVYGGRADALGETILLRDVPHTVVGVMPATFRSIPAADLWTPLRTTLADNGANYRVIGRLREDVTLTHAAEELDALRTGIAGAFPRYAQTIAAYRWMPYREYLGANVRQLLLVQLAAVGFLLLIACVNVASLQLTRALARRRELAVRSALGSSRARLIRQVLTESTLLALLGGIVGLGIALACTQLLLGLVSQEMSRDMLSGEAAGVDWRVLGFTGVVAIASGLIFGIAPALAATRTDLRASMSEGLGTTLSRRTVWLRRSLAGAQIALACILLVGAGLLVRSFVKLSGSELGFNPSGVLVGRMSLQGAIDAPALELLLGQAMERVRRLPGVIAVSASNGVPVERALNLPLQPPAHSIVTQPRSVDWRYVTPAYFEVFDIQLVAGRLFDERDTPAAPPVAIVNEAFARGYFGRVNVVGETITIGEIVGVVGNAKAGSGAGWTRGLTALGSESAPTMFQPAGQAAASMSGWLRDGFNLAWSVRANGARPEREREMQEAVRAVDPRLSFIRFEPMDAVIDRDLDVPRFAANLFGGFALVALVLSGIGLYGLTAYAATQRARETGIRMALGATAGRTLRHFMTEGLAVAGVGLLLGIVGAALVTQVLAALLFGVTPLDSVTFAGVAALLLAIAAASTLVPAARAARINPVDALRGE